MPVSDDVFGAEGETNIEKRKRMSGGKKERKENEKKRNEMRARKTDKETEKRARK